MGKWKRMAGSYEDVLRVVTTVDTSELTDPECREMLNDIIKLAEVVLQLEQTNLDSEYRK